MPENPELRPATGEEIEEALAFALRFDGRKRAHQGDEFMARITAERLVAHLACLAVRGDEKAALGAAYNPENAPGRSELAANRAIFAVPYSELFWNPTTARLERPAFCAICLG